MSNSQLLTTSFDEGVRAPNYFNGRLLAAEDLKADQDAVLARQGWLGKACGYGVIEGLMVSQATSTSVLVTQGLGINRQGQVMHLQYDTTLAFSIQSTSSQTIDEAGRFKNCAFTPAGNGSSLGDGAYLLTVIPASRLEGQAPMKAAAGSTSAPGCAGQWEVEGLQFKIIRLAGFEAAIPHTTESDRQNRLAHWCFGSQHLPELAADPFHFNDNFDAFDQLDPNDFTPCDLPLAVFYWISGALTFVDAWTARLRLVRPDALDETQETISPGFRFQIPAGLSPISAVGTRVPSIIPLSVPFIQIKTRTWKGILSDKRVAEGQARFLQFQAQANSLINAGNVGSVRATDYFPWMPPAGFLPITIESLLQAVESALQFSSASWQIPVSKLPDITLAARFTPALAQTIGATTPSMTRLMASEIGSAITSGTPADARFLALANYSQSTNDQLSQLQAQVKTLTDKLNQLESRLPGTTTSEGTPKPVRQANRNKLQRRERLLQREMLTMMQPRQALQGIERGRVNNGFDLVQFFSNLPIHIGLLDRETVDFIIQRSWYDEAVNLDQAQAQLAGAAPSLLTPANNPLTAGGELLRANINEPIIAGGFSIGRSSRRSVLVPLFEVYIVLENLVSTQDQLYIVFTKVIRPTTWLNLIEKIKG
jgi:hypothetical protein